MSQHRLNWCCESAPAWEHLEMPQKELDSVWEDGMSGFPFWSQQFEYIIVLFSQQIWVNICTFKSNNSGS